jgi:hypothetical protein
VYPFAFHLEDFDQKTRNRYLIGKEHFHQNQIASTTTSKKEIHSYINNSITKMQNHYLVSIIILSLCYLQVNDAVNLITTNVVGTWFGNSKGTGALHIQQDCMFMYVTPEGIVASGTYWDEGGADVALYYNGSRIARFDNMGANGNIFKFFYFLLY